MGGQSAGEVAAQLAVDSISTTWQDGDLATLVDALRRAHREIVNAGRADRSLRGMGTTIVALAVLDSGALGVASVGDSRAYLLRDAALVPLTEDHNLAQEMVRRGELSARQATIDPFRNVLSRALGVDGSDPPDVAVDALAVSPEGVERVLLCSDGLTNECLDDELLAVLRANPDDAAAADALVAAAVAHGGRDNVTAIAGHLADHVSPV
jgi:PPM family protein phosphatase